MKDKLLPVAVALSTAALISAILLFVEWWGCGFQSIAVCNFGG